MLTIAVANLKGGTTKTTTSAMIGHAIAQLRGSSVLFVDADPPGSLLRWSELGGWQQPVIGLPVKDIHKRLPGLSAASDVVVIDTPPLDDQAGIVYSALRAADIVLVPVSPTTMELDRLTPILNAVQEVEPMRATPAHTRVLLTRVVTGANSGKSARSVLVNAGISVLDAAVPRLERYAQAFGADVALQPGDPYIAAAEELLLTVDKDTH